MRVSVFAVTGLMAMMLFTGCNKNAVDALKLAKSAETKSQEDWKAASEDYKAANKMDPKNHHIPAKLAALYEKQKMYAEAAEWYAKAAASDLPDSDNFAKYHFRRGYAFYELARKDVARQGFDKAIEPFKKAINKDPNIADAYYYMGKTLYEMDDEQGALDALTKAIETRSDQLHYYVDLSRLYLDLLLFDQGLTVALEGIKIVEGGHIKTKNDAEKTEVSDAYYNLRINEARAYDALNKPEQKIAALEKTRQVPNPKNAPREAEFELAIAYHDKGKPQEACQALLSYLKLPPGKTPEAISKHSDAEQKKAKWKC